MLERAADRARPAGGQLSGDLSGQAVEPAGAGGRVLGRRRARCPPRLGLGASRPGQGLLVVLGRLRGLEPRRRGLPALPGIGQALGEGRQRLGLGRGLLALSRQVVPLLPEPCQLFGDRLDLGVLVFDGRASLGQ